jgi:nucleoside-diphosphate-sugar epimerase
MRILITGHAGMIGSELCHQLSALGHELLGCDDLSHDCVEVGSLPVKQNILCSVEQLPLFETMLHPLDLIIHCASPIGHAMLTPAAEIAWKIISGTQAVLDLALRTGARLITFSSSEVLSYRGETDIRAQYSLGKLTSEAMALGHPSVDAKVIRPYNVTGRLQRADGGFVMARFRDAALKGEPLTVFGSGEQKRCFLHVTDFARFVCLLVEWWPEHKVWSVFNPTNQTTINDLVVMFKNAAGISLNSPTSYWQDGATVLNNPDWRDTPERQIHSLWFDDCTSLGWKPKVSLEEIVKDHLNVGVPTAKVISHD